MTAGAVRPTSTADTARTLMTVLEPTVAQGVVERGDPVVEAVVEPVVDAARRGPDATGAALVNPSRPTRRG